MSKLTARLGDQDDFFLGSLSSDIPPPPPPAPPQQFDDNVGINVSEQCHSDGVVNLNSSRSNEGQGPDETDEQFYDADSSIHRQPTPPPPPLTSDLDELESEDQGHNDSTGQGHQDEDQEGAVYV